VSPAVPRTGWSQRQRASLQTQVRKHFSMTRASSIAAIRFQFGHDFGRPLNWIKKPDWGGKMPENKFGIGSVLAG
jgi:hypothetical protein